MGNDVASNWSQHWSKPWLKHWSKQLGCALGMLAVTALFTLLWIAPAQAVARHQWQLTGQSADGLAQQYIDLNSIQGRGGYWLVHSYFTEQRGRADGSGPVEPVRADYVTLYDCDRQRYRDVDPEGFTLEQFNPSLLPESAWGSATADPLNQATLDYVCQQSAPA